MSTEYGILILFFDLPTESKEERRIYAKFIKEIKREGFYIIQKSIYMKKLNNSKIKEMDIQRIKKISPKIGNIKILFLTENQFNAIYNIAGEEISFNKNKILII